MDSWLFVTAVAAGVLAWTWIFYPVAIWLASRLRRGGEATEPQHWPTVTCVLAALDDAPAIAARVTDFLAADYPADRINVVVGVDSPDDTGIAAVLAACGSARVRVVMADASGGKAAALNAAVRAATGDVLVFSDLQQRFAPDAIRLLVTHLLADDRLAAVGGALQLPGDLRPLARRSPVEWYWGLERWLRAAEARLHSSVGLSGSIYALRHDAWVPMPPHLILDDVWLPMRLVLAGRRVGYLLSAKAFDARSTTARVERIRKVRTLTGNFQLVAWLPVLLVPIRNPIWVQFVSHKLLRLLTPWLVLAFVTGAVGVLVHQLRPDLLLAAIGVTAVAALVVFARPASRAIAVRVAEWGWSLQVALVEATMNGVRGRWNVWR